MPASEDTEDSWTAWWNARLAAMESILGESDDIVGHATIPFFVGADLGGATDIVYFRHYAILLLPRNAAPSVPSPRRDPQIKSGEGSRGERQIPRPMAPGFRLSPE